MKVVIDLDTIDGYRQFLRVKSLPIYSFTGREAWFPDEYSERVGVIPFVSNASKYTPRSWLFDYQRDIAAIAIRRRKFAVFADCGLGKTAILFEFARHALDNLRNNRCVLLVSPPNVVAQTMAECAKFYGEDLPIERVRAANLQQWLLSGKSRFGITNYEALSDKITDAGRLGALIADESSVLKSHYGRWGTRLIHLGRGIDWKLCLTGTPAPNDRIEYANHAVFLDQYPTINSFLARFFVNRGETSGRWELKPHALRPFYRALSHWCIFLNNPAVYGWKDNTDPLPPIRTHILDVPLSDKQRADAMSVTGNLFGVPGGIGERQKIARIAKGSDGGKPAFVANLVKREKSSCLVWCKYNPEQEELARLLPDAANISGNTPEDKRLELIAEFQNGTRNEAISKAKILGFGLNLQIVRRMVFSTLQDSYEDYYQCVKRANRYGSKHPLDVYVPLTELERPMFETVLPKIDRIRTDTAEQERLFKEVGYDSL
jgi:superfamily II DNA or RNA helicase